MSDLHPEARALIEAAKRGETPLSAAARARVRRSVAGRAVALGAALTSTATASAAAKGGVLTALLASPLASAGMIGVLGGVSFFLVRGAWVTPEPLRSSARPVASHVAAPSGARAGGRSLELPVREGSPYVGASVAARSEGSAASTVPPVKATERVPIALTPIAPARIALEPTALKPIPAAAKAMAPADDQATRLQAATVPRSEVPLIQAEHDLRPMVEGSLPTSSVALPEAAGERALPAPRDLGTALDVLHRAHAALRSGQPAHALDLLRSNEAVLDEGPFAEEAEAARASALCQTGRVQEAHATIARFLSAWPASPLAARLREGCPALGGAENHPVK